MSDNPTIKKYPDGAVLVSFKNTLPNPEKPTKLELFLHSHTLEDQAKFELPIERPNFPVLVRAKRIKRTWQPTERERVILSFSPGLKNMRKYCQFLDDKKVPFPEDWQKKGWPKNHVEAWDSKNDRLQNLLQSERNNVWNKAKKGV